MARCGFAEFGITDPVRFAAWFAAFAVQIFDHNRAADLRTTLLDCRRDKMGNNILARVPIINLVERQEVRSLLARQRNFETTDIVRLAAWIAAFAVQIFAHVRLGGRSVNLRITLSR